MLSLTSATGNAHKAAEMAEILAELGGITLLDRPPGIPEAVEDGETFLDNALLKAFSIVDATGTPALADDSGLIVDALGGDPGVRSARYAGEDATDAMNRTKLLAVLEELSDRGGERRARFWATVVAAFPDGTAVVADGVVEGRIASAAVGDGGFGYDPLFIPDEADGRTFAELSSAEKHAISHRGRALTSLVEALRHQGRL